MELHTWIPRRKTTRNFSMEPVSAQELQRIRDFIGSCQPLVPGIRVRAEIIGIDAVRCILPWKTPHYIAVFTEDAPHAWENAGFLFQQVELYIQSLGLGTCWLGMGHLNPRGQQAAPEEDGLQFAIMMAFGRGKGQLLRNSVQEFRRKTMTEITDREDDRLEPARLAPSSVNSQPWYFVHGEDGAIHAFCALQGLLKQTMLGRMNRIDIGIALAHLYLSHPGFRFFTASPPPVKKGYGYIGSFQL